MVIEEPLNGKSLKLCGNQIPKPFNVSSNELKIAFKSREHLGKSKPGFVATYTSGTTPGKMKASADFQIDLPLTLVLLPRFGTGSTFCLNARAHFSPFLVVLCRLPLSARIGRVC